MSDPQGAPDGANGTGAPATAPAAPTADAGRSGIGNGSAEQPTFNHREFVGLRQEVRELTGFVRNLVDTRRDAPAPQPAVPQRTVEPTRTADAAPQRDERTELRLAELDLQDAIEEQGIDLAREERILLKKVFRGDRPTNVKQWLSETLPLVKRPAPAAAVVAAPAPQVQPPPQSTPTPNLGAPNAAPPSMSDDVRSIPKDVARSMDPNEYARVRDATLERLNPGNRLLKRPTRPTR